MDLKSCVATASQSPSGPELPEPSRRRSAAAVTGRLWMQGEDAAEVAESPHGYPGPARQDRPARVTAGVGWGLRRTVTTVVGVSVAR